MTSRFHVLTLATLVLAAACGDSITPNAPDATPSSDAAPSPDATAPSPDASTPSPDAPLSLPTPSVESTSPGDGATAVPVNRGIIVRFTEVMDPATLTTASFKLRAGVADLAGTVIVNDQTAVFWPAAHLASNGSFTATITTAAHSAAGVALAAPHSWTFSTNDVAAPGLPVSLGTAGDFVLLAKSGISTVPASAITGDLGVSPAAASYITGFSLTAGATQDFSTSTQVTGKVYAADYAVPTPAKMTKAIGDMNLAFLDAAGRAPDITELGAGDIGGMTMYPGVYKWSSGLLIPTSITLNGDATAVWIFQIAQDLTMNSAVRVSLSGGALPQNVFWQVAGRVELGTTAHLEGVVLTKTSVTLRTGASVLGRLLAQTAIDIDSSTIVQPAD